MKKVESKINLCKNFQRKEMWKIREFIEFSTLYFFLHLFHDFFPRS